MKKTLALLASLMLVSAVPAFAADQDWSTQEGMTRCMVQSESIASKVERLKTEINTNKKNYTPAELKAMEKKLKETNDFLDQIMNSQRGSN